MDESSEAHAATPKQVPASTPTKKSGMVNKAKDKKAADDDDGLSNVSLPKRPSSVSLSSSNNSKNNNNNNNNAASKTSGVEKSPAKQARNSSDTDTLDAAAGADSSPSQLQELNHDFLTDADAATESIGGTWMKLCEHAKGLQF